MVATREELQVLRGALAFDSALVVSTPPGLVERWESDLARLRDEVREARNADRWRVGPDDLLGVLGRDRDEIFHSRLLGWLLDPTGTHGMGTSLLAALFDHLAVSHVRDDLMAAKVELELSRADARADIVITWPAGQLVVENKLDAVEQPQQCARLASDHPNAVLVFLTPGGDRPATAGATLERWVPMPWRTMRRLVESSLDSAASSPGRHAAAEYLKTIQRLFP